MSDEETAQDAQAVPGDTHSSAHSHPGTFNPRAPPIYFFDRGQKYFEFTNFSDYPVRYNMKDYRTSEHLFQALKVC
jgi:hypothetical protein